MNIRYARLDDNHVGIRFVFDKTEKTTSILRGRGLVSMHLL
jgi:hypothetical protein